MQPAETETTPSDDENMNCMELWGGHGATNNRLRRPGLDVLIWSDPRNSTDAGGGDLHLLSSCASGRITRMLLADVCGFGPLFADISSELRELLKRNVNTIKQSRAVREMSCRLDEAAHRGGFASTLMSTYFAPTRSFALCNAGHPPPLLYRAADANWSVLRNTPSPASVADTFSGVLRSEEYQQFKTNLAIGDMVLSYSNSLTECRRSDGVTMGLNGLVERLRELDPARPADIGPSLANHIRDEHPENLSKEDATILLCRATETPVTWRDKLLAPIRMLRSASDKTNIG
jgi:hypothetical protein